MWSSGGAPPKAAKKYDYVTVEDYGGSILGRLSAVFQRAVKSVSSSEKENR